MHPPGAAPAPSMGHRHLQSCWGVGAQLECAQEHAAGITAPGFACSVSTRQRYVLLSLSVSLGRPTDRSKSGPCYQHHFPRLTFFRLQNPPMTLSDRELAVLFNQHWVLGCLLQGLQQATEIEIKIKYKGDETKALDKASLFSPALSLGAIAKHWCSSVLPGGTRNLQVWSKCLWTAQVKERATEKDASPSTNLKKI